MVGLSTSTEVPVEPGVHMQVVPSRSARSAPQLLPSLQPAPSREDRPASQQDQLLPSSLQPAHSEVDTAPATLPRQSSVARRIFERVRLLRHGNRVSDEGELEKQVAMHRDSELHASSKLSHQGQQGPPLRAAAAPPPEDGGRLPRQLLLGNGKFRQAHWT